MNGFRRHLYNFWKVSEDTYLHFGPSQIAPLSQKLVFKAKICGEGGPVGVSRGHAPLESEVFYYFKGLLEVLVM